MSCPTGVSSMLSVAETSVALYLRSRVRTRASSTRLRFIRESLYTITKVTSRCCLMRSNIAWKAGRLSMLVAVLPGSMYSSITCTPIWAALRMQASRWAGMEMPSGS
jgi:hypothetical protein